MRVCGSAAVTVTGDSTWIPIAGSSVGSGGASATGGSTTGIAGAATAGCPGIATLERDGANARDAIESRGLGRGKISIRTRKRGNFAEIEFQDDGIGMSEKTKAKAFNPFFTTKSDGVGLGLAIVSKIVDEHGGTISVESDPGDGSIFRLYLPVK